jgi:hypothetical protein
MINGTYCLSGLLSLYLVLWPNQINDIEFSAIPYRPVIDVAPPKPVIEKPSPRTSCICPSGPTPLVVKGDYLETNHFGLDNDTNER